MGETRVRQPDARHGRDGVVQINPITGAGRMPTAKEVNKFVKEEKIQASKVKAEAAALDRAAKAKAAVILANADLIVDPRQRAAALRAAKQKVQIQKQMLEAKLQMARAQMVVDGLSFIDPTPATTLVSIWMDVQMSEFD